MWLTYLEAVVLIVSTASIILCNAESAPIVISVPQKSLSIEPTYIEKMTHNLSKSQFNFDRHHMACKT